MKETKVSVLSRKRTDIILGCLLLTLLASIPLFTDGMSVGTDLQYQLLRIEVLKDGLKATGPLLWVIPDWIEPKGYSFVFFYGNTFLYIPALLRLLGMNVMASYQAFMVLVNAATAFGSFAAFRKIFGDSATGFLGSTLYTMSVYRVFLLYAEAELGEALALIFLPFVLTGICLVFGRRDEERKNGWLWIAMGCSGMLRSHILSFGIAVLFVFFFTVISFRKLKNAVIWKQMGLSLAAFALMNLNYFYSVIQYVRLGGFSLNPVIGIPVQKKGVQLMQLFMGFYQAGTGHEFGEQGMAGAAPIGLGIVFLAVILVFCYLVFVYGDVFEKEEKERGYAALGFGAAASYLGTLWFPWDFILKWSEIFASWISAMQAPWHFLQAALVAFTALGCITYRMVKKKYGGGFGKIYGFGLGAASCVFSSYVIAGISFYYGFVRIKTAEELWMPTEKEYETTLPILAAGIQMCEADIIWYVLTAISVMAFAGCVAYALKKRN